MQNWSWLQRKTFQVGLWSNKLYLLEALRNGPHIGCWSAEKAGRRKMQFRRLMKWIERGIWLLNCFSSSSSTLFPLTSYFLHFSSLHSFVFLSLLLISNFLIMITFVMLVKNLLVSSLIKLRARSTRIFIRACQIVWKYLQF